MVVTLSAIQQAMVLPPAKALEALRSLYRKARASVDEAGAEAALHVALAVAVEAALPARGFARGCVWLLKKGATPETRRKIRRVSQSTGWTLVANALRRTKAQNLPAATDEVSRAIARAEAEQDPS